MTLRLARGPRPPASPPATAAVPVAVAHDGRKAGGGSGLASGAFETVGKAVQRITELERSARNGLFLRTYVDPLSADDEALGHLEYKGEIAAYVIKRERRTH
jgi:hypothetical protein